MWESAWTLLILAQPLIASLAVDGYRPAPDPGPHPACPPNMRLVQGVHFDELERLCLKVKAQRCWSFVDQAAAMTGTRTEMRFCMDQYEAPNRRNAKPLVMMDFHESERWCRKKGKRLCSEQEFETACEGPVIEPFFYGWAVDPTVCNSNKPWKAFDDAKLLAGGREAQQEAARLWQGTPSGAKARCRTRNGIYDLLGNVEEWVSSRPGRRWPGALMGGFWAKPWTGCRGTNDAHEPNFAFYEVGFRCCKDAE